MYSGLKDKIMKIKFITYLQRNMESLEKLSTKELFKLGAKNLDKKIEVTEKYDFSKKIDRSEEVQRFRMKSLEEYGNTGGEDDKILKEVINEMCDDLEYDIKKSDEFYNNASYLVQKMVKLQDTMEKEELCKRENFKKERTKEITEYPTISGFDYLQKDIIILFENKKFFEDMVVTISDLHTIEEWIEILNPEEKSDVWYKKIDDKLEEIEIREDFSKYIVEMEKLRELFRNSFNMVKWMPIVLKCSQCSLCYYLKLLEYGNFKRISEYSDMVKIEDGEKPHMLNILLNKIIFTIHYISMNIILNGRSVKPLEWGTKEENEKKLSKQAFMEYNDYLLENGVFDSQRLSSLGGCTIL